MLKHFLNGVWPFVHLSGCERLNTGMRRKRTESSKVANLKGIMHNVSTVTQVSFKSCGTLSTEASRPTPALYNMLLSASHFQSTTSQTGLTLPFIRPESPSLCGPEVQRQFNSSILSTVVRAFQSHWQLRVVLILAGGICKYTVVWKRCFFSWRLLMSLFPLPHRSSQFFTALNRNTFQS